MRRIKPRSPRFCACGHEEDDHDATGKCHYDGGGAGFVCECPRFKARGRVGGRKSGKKQQHERHEEPENMQRDTILQLCAHLRDAVEALQKCLAVIERDIRVDTIAYVVDPKPKPVKESKLAKDSVGFSLSRCESKILAALKLRPKGATKAQIAVLTGYRPTSGSFNQAIADLIADGHVVTFDRARKMVHMLTDTGKATVVHVKPSEPDVLDMWMTRLKTAERNVLACIARKHPTRIDKEEIASLTTYSITSGSFNQALANLKKIDLIEGSDDFGLTEAFAGEMKR